MKHLSKIPIVVAVTLSILFLSIIFAEFSNASEVRRTMELYDTGEKTDSGAPIYGHRELLEPDQCGWYGCVIDEYYVENWDNTRWVYQLVDSDGDFKCDIQIVWKPIADPSYGVFYAHAGTRTCEFAPHTELD